MTRKSIITLVAASVAVFGMRASTCASDVILSVQLDTTNQTWAVTAVSSDSQNLGIASFAIDVLGTGGISILKAVNPADTLVAPSAYFDILRNTGTISGQNLLDIHASQDTIGAANAFNDSGILYGYGLSGTGSGTFVGPITGLGPAILAQGSYSNDGTGGTISARIATGAFVNLFPLNWDVDHNPGLPGSVQHTEFASNSPGLGGNPPPPPPVDIPPVPEPSPLVLTVLGVLGLVLAARVRIT
jgi:hypothetical protein